MIDRLTLFKAQTVNTELSVLWQVSDRIRKNILEEKRAEYGRGILQALTAKLSRTHLIQLIYIDDPLKRDFYAEMCRIENWNTRVLSKKINSLVFERTALSRKPAKLVEMELKRLSKEDKLTPALVLLYWNVGDRIRKEILEEKRAEYGEGILPTLSAKLAPKFGRGFGTRNLFRMIRFAEVFPDIKIVSALRTQLGWTHFRQIIAMDDPLKSDFVPKAQLERKLHETVRLVRTRFAQSQLAEPKRRRRKARTLRK